MHNSKEKLNYSQPFFSIVLPTYNRASMLPRAINSVLEQKFDNWELIIIDDGSTDDTRKVVDEFKDLRIIYIFQENAERSAARNKGIDLSSGKYICFLDSDDFYLPNHLEAFYNKIIELNEPVAFFYSKLFIEENEILSLPEELNCAHNNFVEFVIQYLICPQQSCLHHEILKKHQFNPKLNIGEDLNLWLRVVMNYPLINVDQRTIILCIHEDRTVNIKRRNVFRKHFESIKLTFEDHNIKKQISSSLRKFVFADCYLGMGKYYIFQNMKWKALSMIFLSLLYKPNFQLKFKINIIYCIIFDYKKALEIAN